MNGPDRTDGLLHRSNFGEQLECDLLLEKNLRLAFYLMSSQPSNSGHKPVSSNIRVKSSLLPCYKSCFAFTQALYERSMTFSRKTIGHFDEGSFKMNVCVKSFRQNFLGEYKACFVNETNLGTVLFDFFRAIGGGIKLCTRPVFNW